MYMTHSERMYRISLHDCVCRVIRMVPKIVLLFTRSFSYHAQQQGLFPVLCSRVLLSSACAQDDLHSSMDEVFQALAPVGLAFQHTHGLLRCVGGLNRVVAHSNASHGNSRRAYGYS
jgi:hypothetical protein